MADKYASMTDLLKDPANVEGVHYTLTSVDNPFSDVAVTAVHGGNLERGTSELADLIREMGNYNYFSFDALISPASDFHVTSTHYDEPTVLNMMTRCKRVVGCHGKSGTDLTVYVGGLDAPLRNAIWTKLTQAGFACEVSPSGIAGVEPDNITNRTKTGAGVQLEITTELRKTFFVDKDWNNRSRDNWTQTIYDFASAVYEAIEESYPKTDMDIGTSYKMDLKGDLDYGKGYKTDIYEDINAVQGDLDANRNNWNEGWSRVQNWSTEESDGTVSVNGGMIKAGSILLNRMAVGTFENMYQNGSFEFGALGWKSASAWSVVTTNPADAFMGNNYAEGTWGSAGSISFYDQNEIEVREGETYYWEGYFKTDLATTTKARTILIKMLDKNNVESFVIREETLTTSWQKFYYTFQIPAGITKIILGLSVKGGLPAGFKTQVDNVFCKKMMTGELIVDGTISGTAIKAGTLSWDAGFGGTLTLGGLNNGNGELRVVNADGETAVQLNTIDQDGTFASGFQKVNAKTVYASDGITAPNVINTTTDVVNYYVDPINGNDDADGTSWTAGALATIQEAVDRLPKILSHDVKIEIHYANGTEINEKVLVQGFTGNGILTFNFQRSTNVVYGNFKFMYNTIRIEMSYGKVFAIDGTQPPIYAEGTAKLGLSNTICDAKGLNPYAIMISNGFADLRNAEFYNGTKAQILGGYGARVDVVNCKGSGGTWGMDAYRSAIIAGTGTAPNGTSGISTTEDGGLVTGTWTSGSQTAPSTPAPITYTTVKVTADSANSWRPNFSGQWYGGNVRQGKYSSYGRYYGMWFFGNKFDQFNGKTITKVRIYASRRNEGGSSSAQNARFILHGHATQPTGKPSVYGGDSTGVAAVSSFKWGQAKWVDVTSAFKSSINQTAVKGIGLWVYADSPYMIFNTSLTVEVTYK